MGAEVTFRMTMTMTKQNWKNRKNKKKSGAGEGGSAQNCTKTGRQKNQEINQLGLEGYTYNKNAF